MDNSKYLKYLKYKKKYLHLKKTIAKGGSIKIASGKKAQIFIINSSNEESYKIIESLKVKVEEETKYSLELKVILFGVKPETIKTISFDSKYCEEIYKIQKNTFEEINLINLDKIYLDNNFNAVTQETNIYINTKKGDYIKDTLLEYLFVIILDLDQNNCVTKPSEIICYNYYKIDKNILFYFPENCEYYIIKKDYTSNNLYKPTKYKASDLRIVEEEEKYKFFDSQNLIATAIKKNLDLYLNKKNLDVYPDVCDELP